jgi:hypothetical protein
MILRPKIVIALVAAIAALSLLGAGEASARGPVITGVNVVNQQATYSWSDPSGVKGLFVETATRGTTNEFGYFFPGSILYNFNVVGETQTTLTDEREYPQGTYYVHIAGRDRAHCNKIEFSAIMIFHVDAAGNGTGSSFSPQPPTCPGGGSGGSGGDKPSQLVKYRHRQDVDKLLVRARMDEAGTLTANASVTIGKSTKLYRFLSATRTVPADKLTSLRLKLKRHDLRIVKRALKRKRSLRAKITVIARNLAGANVSKTVTVRLKDG